MWVDAKSGLAFVRIASPTPGEQEWAEMLAPAIDSAISSFLGDADIGPGAEAEIHAAAHRAFGYGWKYREAPFGEAQWLDAQGGTVRLAHDWIEHIKPILERHRDVGMMVG